MSFLKSWHEVGCNADGDDSWPWVEVVVDSSENFRIDAFILGEYKGILNIQAGCQIEVLKQFSKIISKRQVVYPKE